MLYTSYFGNLENIPTNIIPISICGKAPDGWNGLQYKKLAPKYAFWKVWEQTKDNDFYVKCFNEQVLSKLNPTTVFSELQKLSQSQDIVLLCYEKPNEFCHRHLVAEWFIKNNIPVKEWHKEI